MSTYMDIIVRCTAVMATQLIDEMCSFIEKDAMSETWCHDMDSPELAIRTGAAPYALFFYKDVTGEIIAALALAYMSAGEEYNEGRLCVANVVPRIKDKLDPNEYNNIAKQFVDEILNPILNNKWPKLTCEMSQADGCDTVKISSTSEDDDENIFDEQYADFKFKLPQSNQIITHTCNPDKLANMFGSNSTAPHFLTPVLFRTAVLDKYRDEPSRYDVGNGCLRCKRNGSVLWCISIDHHGDSCVSVWLGDLGHLPYAHQLHFASQNILAGEVSDTFFRSQIGAEFCGSPHPVAVFKRYYYRLRTVGWEELGWHVILPLAEDDAHYIKSLKLLTHNEQREFDEQVLALTKILIDSLNESEFHKLLPCDDRGISLLEKVLTCQGIVGGEVHIKYLRNLQSMRSASVAHRKGKEYDKMCRRIGLDNLSLSEVMRKFVIGGSNFLQFMIQNIDKFK